MKWLRAALEAIASLFTFLGNKQRIELADKKLEIKRPKKEARVEKQTDRINHRAEEKKERRERRDERRNNNNGVS